MRIIGRSQRGLDRTRTLPLALLLLMAVAGCSPFYVIRAGYEEAKILSRRRPIVEVVADSATPEQVREKLRLVLDARDFAHDSLGLSVGESYTTYSRLDSDTLAHIVSAAYQDRFAPYTWWFPIVGHVPYKGFFSLEDARDEAAKLRAEGYDTYIRPTSAFSTLGWFNDPLVSPLLRYDSVTLAGTVIHELLHNTYYASGEAMFNESLAQFVGSRGAIAFLCGRLGETSDGCARARADWHDEMVFGGFLDGLVQRLDSLYSRTDLTREEKVRQREEIFEDARERFVDEVQPRFLASSYSGFLRTPLNNATLISRRLYYHRLDLFERVFETSGRDLRRTIDRILAAARSRKDDPYAGVEGL
jgi:predicted aminopeptidase